MIFFRKGHGIKTPLSHLDKAPLHLVDFDMEEALKLAGDPEEVKRTLRGLPLLQTLPSPKSMGEAISAFSFAASLQVW